jgi:hypothetical protein
MNSRSSRIVPTDTEIGQERNRAGRLAVLLGFVLVTTALIVPFVVYLMTALFPANGLVAGLSWGVGLMAAILAVGIGLTRFIVRNPPNMMSITQDNFASLLGHPAVNISYGPGTHICFPWETAQSEYGVQLQEQSRSFVFETQLADGTLNGSGSVRFRPDHMNPMVYFTGSAKSEVEGIDDLIIAEVQSFLVGMSALDAIDSLAALNRHLAARFLNQDTEFEQQNGILVSDVSIAKLTPSAKLQQTLGGMTEAVAVQRGVALMLGMSPMEVRKQLDNGILSTQEYNKAREHFLALSGNLGGMQINRQEFDLSVRGLDAEVMKELVQLAKSPLVQALAGKQADSSK